MSKRGELEKQIRYVLENDEQSRNSDIRLTQMVWWRYHNRSMRTIDGKVYVEIKELFTLPREDHIKRIRAKIQNDMKEFLRMILLSITHLTKVSRCRRCLTITITTC